MYDGAFQLALESEVTRTARTHLGTDETLCGNCGTSKARHDRPQDWSTVIDWRTEQLCPSCVASYTDWSDWSYDASTRTYRHR